MKFKRIFTASLLIVCAVIYGQEEKTVAKLKPYFGLKAGVNLHPTKEPEGDTNYSAGFQVGLTLTVPISSKFSFQPELLVQNIGTQYDDYAAFSNGYISEETKIRSWYLIVPLNFKWAVSKKVGIELGPNVSYLLSGKQKVTTTSNLSGNVMVSERTYDSDSNTKKLAFGANLGTEYNITDKIYAGLRYTLFISEYQSADDTFSNSVFALSLGYNFR